MNVAFQRNIGSFITAMAGVANSSVTAGGAGDNTDINGLTIDRNYLTPVVLSGLFVIQFNATLGIDESCEVSCTFEDSADGVTWADYLPGPGESSAVVVTLSGERTAQFKCQLGGARRYIRAVPKFNCSASATDTVAVRAGVWIFGGADELPMDVANIVEGISD